MALLQRIGIRLPIFQAPMSGVATPALAAAVSNAGGLGGLGLATPDAAGVRKAIKETQALTDKPFNVNFFVNTVPLADQQRDTAWLDFLAPLFAEFDAKPPTSLTATSKSFTEHSDDLLAVLLETRPRVVSFHFGLPPVAVLSALHHAGIILLATATSLPEARLIEAATPYLAGIIAQGIEAGGHRGTFSLDTDDDEGLPTSSLTRLLVRESTLPVISAGGIMDGAGVAAALRLGAVAAQLGTAFVSCPESAADGAYRAALLGPAAHSTTLTRLISGRPARGISNRFTRLSKAIEERGDVVVPDYPVAYDAGKKLHAAAKAKGDSGFAAMWAGQGAPLSRAMPATELVAALAEEIAAAQKG